MGIDPAFAFVSLAAGAGIGLLVVLNLWDYTRRPVEWETFRAEKPLVGINGEPVVGRYAARRWNGRAWEYRNVTEQEHWDEFDVEAW